MCTFNHIQLKAQPFYACIQYFGKENRKTREAKCSFSYSVFYSVRVLKEGKQLSPNFLFNICSFELLLKIAVQLISIKFGINSSSPTWEMILYHRRQIVFSGIFLIFFFHILKVQKVQCLYLETGVVMGTCVPLFKGKLISCKSNYIIQWF